jgi:hypothetical protein
MAGSIPDASTAFAALCCATAGNGKVLGTDACEHRAQCNLLHHICNLMILTCFSLCYLFVYSAIIFIIRV